MVPFLKSSGYNVKKGIILLLRLPRILNYRKHSFSSLNHCFDVTIVYVKSWMFKWSSEVVIFANCAFNIDAFINWSLSCLMVKITRCLDSRFRCRVYPVVRTIHELSEVLGFSFVLTGVTLYFVVFVCILVRNSSMNLIRNSSMKPSVRTWCKFPLSYLIVDIMIMYGQPNTLSYYFIGFVIRCPVLTNIWSFGNHYEDQGG